METQSDFQLSSYDYDLPEDLIAQHPVKPRDCSRLLISNYKEMAWTDSEFKRLADYLPENSLIVFNQTKVLPCRLIGQKQSGGKCEILLVEPNIGHDEFYAMIKCSGKKQPGMSFLIGKSKPRRSTVDEIKENGIFKMRWDKALDIEWLEENADIPLPPYIREGQAALSDREDYQTVYAKDEGSCAAPTAGLHFTAEVFANLAKKNIQTAAVTLHVGPGTFKPVQSDDIREHSMHKEWFQITQENADKIAKYWGNIISVGTTTLRALESHINEEGDFLGSTEGKETSIFLYPGRPILSSKGLITNFHLPKSSLLMLVSAFCSRSFVQETYKRAINERYRFYSYGDAGLFLR